MSQKVLFIAYVWPELRSTAASQNIITYANLFKRLGHDVYFASAAQVSEQSFAFKEHDIEQIEISLNCDSFDETLKHLKPDIVVFDRFLTEEQYAWRVAKVLPKCLRILDCEDLHCLREARRLEYKLAKNNKANSKFPTANIPQNLNTLDITKREIAAIFRCDLSIVLSNFEASLLISHFKLPPSSVLCIGFLERKQHHNTLGYDDRSGFVSIGSFKHEPNWDAVLTLKNHIWPLIRKQLKNAQCHVYGSYLPPKAKALENKRQGFLVHGFAENAHETIAKYRVLLAPINFGAGIKGKLVDAMQVATPSITTEIGAEGIKTDKIEWPGEIEQDFESFAASAVNLHESAIDWRTKSALSKSLLDYRFNHEQLSESLAFKIEKAQLELEQHRDTNFIGRMLLHHSMASTQYMGQWISAKTKLKQVL